MYAWFIRTGFEKLESCTHLQTQPGRIQPIDSSQLAIGWSSTSTRKPEPSRPATQYNYSSRR
ncbi:hypothetical protein [Bordetella pertussis]|uniref:hypothetical protein n=1 Tax=Bordetella pertussis TaxID=520 RepID=UPI0012681D4E|nr:hypothetical protein [Bordetella pertussis]